MTSVVEALHWAESQLSETDADARVDAQWLLEHVVQKNRAWLRAWPEAALDPDQWQLYQLLVMRRCAGEPVAYLTGRQGFWTLDLDISPATLVPRADTELLVETALTLVPGDNLDVLDLGTGSGAIALALASERPSWRVAATDIDPASLALARRNAERLHIPLQLLQSFWLRDLAPQKFHLIVSNPPYIREDDPHLQGTGVRFEPLRALVAGADGLDALREIVATASGFLHGNGWLMLEHGYDQGESVRNLLQTADWQDVATRQDLGGNDRVTLARWVAKAGL